MYRPLFSSYPLPLTVIVWPSGANPAAWLTDSVGPVEAVAVRPSALSVVAGATVGSPWARAGAGAPAIVASNTPITMVDGNRIWRKLGSYIQGSDNGTGKASFTMYDLPRQSDAVSKPKVFVPDVIEAIAKHMNDDHPDDNVLICRGLGKVDGTTAATMTGMDPDGITFEAATAQGSVTVQIPFGQPIVERADVRHEVVRMYGEACEILDIEPRH